MDPFHAENPCPQCGHLGAAFVRHGARCDSFGAMGEHMHRQCGTCGTEWPEEARALSSRMPGENGPVAVEAEPSRWRAFMYRKTGQWAVSPRVGRTAHS